MSEASARTAGVRRADDHVRGSRRPAGSPSGSVRSGSCVTSTLRVGRGEVVALVGETGAGKSSLVACIARIVEPEDGEVRFDGAPTAHQPRLVRQAGVEVLWQDHGVCDDLDVVGQRRARARAAALAVRRGRRRRRGDVDPAPGRRRQPPARSAGADPLAGPEAARRPRARPAGPAPACSCSTSRPPRSGWWRRCGCSASITEVRESGAGILLVTHDLEQVFSLADRIVVLRQGRVVADVSPWRCSGPTSSPSCRAWRWTRWPSASSSGCAASSTSSPTSSRRRRCPSSCRRWPPPSTRRCSASTCSTARRRRRAAAIGRRRPARAAPRRQRAAADRRRRRLRRARRRRRRRRRGRRPRRPPVPARRTGGPRPARGSSSEWAAPDRRRPRRARHGDRLRRPPSAVPIPNGWSWPGSTSATRRRRSSASGCWRRCRAGTGSSRRCGRCSRRSPGPTGSTAGWRRRSSP